MICSLFWISVIFNNLKSVKNNCLHLVNVYYVSATNEHIYMFYPIKIFPVYKVGTITILIILHMFKLKLSELSDINTDKHGHKADFGALQI